MNQYSNAPTVSPPGMQIDSPRAQRESDITQAYGRLMRVTESLQAEVAQLASRLGPVLRSEPEMVKGAGGETQRSPTTDLGRGIIEQADRLEMTLGTLRGVNHRLEL